MNNLNGSFGKLIRTLSRLTPKQLFYRLLRIAKSRFVYPLLGSALYPRPELDGEGSVLVKEGFQQGHPFDKAPPEVVQKADQLLEGRIELLNLPVSFSSGIDWEARPQDDPLWTYTLHYFEWADPLLKAYAVSGEKEYLLSWRGYVDHWIDHNPPGQGVGWHPYPTSRRLLCWMKACLWLARNEPESVPDRLVPSILQQARFLERNFEFDLLNNHLIANAAALAWAGSLFPGYKLASRWRQKGFSRLWGEILRQVNEEGFHNERSFSYQQIVLADAAEAAVLAEGCGYPIPPEVKERLGKMREALAAVRRPDGKYPLIHDAVEGYPEEDPLAEGEPIYDGSGRSFAFPEAGYVVLRGKESGNDDYLIFDCGPMGPAQNPGHGHAGALSFELFSRGTPLIIDPGVYSYHQQPWRNDFRSTKAHNTLVIDGEDQSELWGSFRVGRMARSQLKEYDITGLEGVAIGKHDGYRWSGSRAVHRREVRYLGTGRWRVIDQVDGSGSHLVEAYFHFSPGADLTAPSKNTIRASCGGEWYLEIDLELPAGCEPILEEGWISSTWYQKEIAPVLRCKWEGPLPARWEYNLRIVG